MTTIQTNAVATIYVHQLKYIFLLWQTTKNTLIIEPHNANKKHMILRRHCWILFHEWVRERVTTDQSGFIKITATATATTMANIEMDFGHCCSSIWMNKRKPSNAFSSNKRMSRARFNILYCCGGSSSSGGSLSFVRSSKIFAWHLFYSNWFKFIASRALSLSPSNFYFPIFPFHFGLCRRIVGFVFVNMLFMQMLSNKCDIGCVPLLFVASVWVCVCVHLATVLIVRNTYILGKFFLLPSSVWLVCLFV